MTGAQDATDAALAEHPQRDELARLVLTVALSAADERRVRLSDGIDELAAEAGLGETSGAVAGIDVLGALRRDELGSAELRRLLGRLCAHAIALAPPADADAARRLCEGLTWLCAHARIEVLSRIDGALDEASAERVWSALAAVVRAAAGRDDGQPEALCALAALVASGSGAARAASAALAEQLDDDLLRALAASRGRSEPIAAPRSLTLEGELVAPPLGPVALVALALSGLLLLRWLWRLCGWLLRRRRPAKLRVAHDGVTVRAEHTLLGRTLRTSELHIPRAGLARATREVRYPRLGLYAGIAALGLGTFLGVALVGDGLRAASPSLIALGAALVVAGVLIDLAFGALLPGKTGKHCLLLVPRKGPRLALRVNDAAAADRAIGLLVEG